VASPMVAPMTPRMTTLMTGPMVGQRCCPARRFLVPPGIRSCCIPPGPRPSTPRRTPIRRRLQPTGSIPSLGAGWLRMFAPPGTFAPCQYDHSPAPCRFARWGRWAFGVTYPLTWSSGVPTRSVHRSRQLPPPLAGGSCSAHRGAPAAAGSKGGECSSCEPTNSWSLSTATPKTE